MFMFSIINLIKSIPNLLLPHTDGIDVSFWQGNIDFHKAREAGARFAFIKASQGTTTDPKFKNNWQASKDAGLLRGAYHYLDWRVAIKPQAEYFANLLSDDPGELAPVLDYESRVEVPSRSAACSAARLFMDIVEQRLGVRCILYTSPGYWMEFGSNDPAWRDYPLWIAHYSKALTAPTIPAPWGRWTFWQYSAHGDGRKYGAESGNIDLDWFAGSEEDLYRFAGLEPPQKLRRLWMPFIGR